jgi:hypothetical protein
MGRIIALIAALVCGFAIFYVQSVTPSPAPASVPADAFSADRAMVDVRAIGSVPHPLGSAANDRVRDYLIARMTALGLSPQVQHGAAFEVLTPEIGGGAVDNVIGVLPGRDRAVPALVIMAHHDSVPGSPGAADDTAGVASALEIVRAIKAKGTPLRDVMVAITDGEEVGLLGARVYFDSPLAAHAGYVINMDTRGGGGRATMFETGDGNGQDIALYRRTAWRPDSNALTVFVYRRLPNDTDFTVAKQHGKVGLNYAFIGRQFDYHSPSSTPGALDEGALQHMGGQILPTAVALAFGPLPGRAPDVVYGNLIGSVTPAYAAGFGWVILAAAAALIVLGAVRGHRRRTLSWADMVRGVGASLYGLAISAVLLDLVRHATGVGGGWLSYRPILARFPLFEVMMLTAAIAAVLATAAFAAGGRSRLASAALALFAGLGAFVFGGFEPVGPSLGAAAALVGVATFGKPARLPGGWTGLLTVAMLVAVAVQVAAPTAAYVFAWPLLAGALAAALTGAGRSRGAPFLIVSSIIAALTLSWLGALFHALLQGLDIPMLAALPTWLALPVLWPLVLPDQPKGAPLRRAHLLPSLAVLLVGLAVAVVLRFTSPWTPRHPNTVEPLFVVDPAAGRAWRASLVEPDAWSRAVLGAEGGKPERISIPLSSHPIDAASAAGVPLPSPAVTMSAQPGGRLLVTARFNPGAAGLYFTLRSPDGIDQVAIDGKPALFHPRGHGAKPFLLKANEQGVIGWAAPEGFTLSFHAGDPEKVEIRTAEIYDRWMSAKPLPPVPAADQMWDQAGATVVIGAPALPPAKQVHEP